MKNKFTQSYPPTFLTHNPFAGAEQHFWSVKRKTNPAWAITFPARHLSRLRRSQFVPLCPTNLILGLYALSFLAKCFFLFHLFFNQFQNIFWNVGWEKFRNEVNIFFWYHSIIFDISSIFHYILVYKDTSSSQFLNCRLTPPFTFHFMGIDSYTVLRKWILLGFM